MISFDHDNDSVCCSACRFRADDARKIVTLRIGIDGLCHAMRLCNSCLSELKEKAKNEKLYRPGKERAW